MSKPFIDHRIYTIKPRGMSEAGMSTWCTTSSHGPKKRTAS